MHAPTLAITPIVIETTLHLKIVEFAALDVADGAMPLRIHICEYISRSKCYIQPAYWCAHAESELWRQHSKQAIYSCTAGSPDPHRSHVQACVYAAAQLPCHIHTCHAMLCTAANAAMQRKKDYQPLCLCECPPASSFSCAACFAPHSWSSKLTALLV